MSQAVQATRNKVTGDLYAEVQTFYARQMRRVDALDIEGFADTFTDDGVVVHANGERAQGREAMVAGMRANLPRYRDIAVRHWFDHLLIETDPRDEDTLRVSYYTLVTQTDREGRVSFQPTFTVEDVLVRRDGELLTRERVIHRDTPVAPPAS
ncbi:nuclear transport factor 2 family protein [Streptomyces glaucosporus]|uniref:Nuclear transport factor 2 family protein n=1 Tax=Streptomyces glaucosporus TaxID=284044 RepID=A0ABP5UM45_9ACTN